jgi:small-conductance mechanosensitive channel
MNNRFLDHMLGGLLRDFGQPVMLWQIAALVAGLALAWLLARFFDRRLDRRRRERPAVLHYGAQSLNDALFPLFGWLIVGALQLALSNFINTALLSLALVPLFGIATIYIAFYVARRVFARSGHVHGLLAVFEKVVSAAIWLGMVLYVTGLLDDIQRWMASVRIHVGNTRLSLLSLSSGLGWVTLTMLVALWAGSVLEERLMRAHSIDGNLRVVVARLGRALLVVGALLISLSIVGIDITVLGVFGGALGVGLGFGLQKIASNYVSGFIILIDRSLRLGDWISVGGFQGTVTQIRTRFTVVRGLDGIETMIPNEKLVADAVQNHSSYLTRGYAKLPVQIAYGSDVEEAMRVLAQAAVGIPRVLDNPAPAAYLAGFGADGINLELGVWIEDAAAGTGKARSDVNLAIWRALRAHGIEIPFAQREVRLVDARVDPFSAPPRRD